MRREDERLSDGEFAAAPARRPGTPRVRRRRGRRRARPRAAAPGSSRRPGCRPSPGPTTTASACCTRSSSAVGRRLIEGVGPQLQVRLGGGEGRGGGLRRHAEHQAGAQRRTRRGRPCAARRSFPTSPPITTTRPRSPLCAPAGNGRQPVGGHRVGHERRPGGVRRRQSDVHHDDVADFVAREEVTTPRRAEGDREVGPRRTPRRAGEQVHAGRAVEGDHRHPEVPQPLDERGGRRPRRPGGTGAEDGVDHERRPSATGRRARLRGRPRRGRCDRTRALSGESVPASAATQTGNVVAMQHPGEHPAVAAVVAGPAATSDATAERRARTGAASTAALARPAASIRVSMAMPSAGRVRPTRRIGRA